MFFIHYIQSSSSQNSGGGGTFFGCPNKRFKFHCPCPYVDRKKNLKKFFFIKKNFQSSSLATGYILYNNNNNKVQGQKFIAIGHRLFCFVVVEKMKYFLT